jgi:hypothetical protein
VAPPYQWRQNAKCCTILVSVEKIDPASLRVAWTDTGLTASFASSAGTLYSLALRFWGRVAVDRCRHDVAGLNMVLVAGKAVEGPWDHLVADGAGGTVAVAGTSHTGVVPVGAAPAAASAAAAAPAPSHATAHSTTAPAAPPAAAAPAVLPSPSPAPVPAPSPSAASPAAVISPAPKPTANAVALASLVFELD